jgi:3-dehydroquinate dehydratase II
MPAKVLVLHGPNLNLVTDLARLDARLEAKAAEAGLELKTFQANSEGALVDALHADRNRVSAVVVNAGRLAPAAEVLAEAIELVKRPTVEVVTDAAVKGRSALKGVVLKQISGKGFDGYLTALELLAQELEPSAARPTGTGLPANGGAASATASDHAAAPQSKEAAKKTLGRRPAESAAAPEAPRKSLGRGEGSARVPAPGLSRKIVRDKISERLAGKLTPAGLATWARTQWQLLQRGAPAESGHRDQLEDVLQTLLLSASSKANDHVLIELMTQLG